MKNENISAFLDGELEDGDIDAMLDELTSPQAREQLRRLNVARAAINGCRSCARDADISAAVAAAVRDEPQPLASPSVVELPGRSSPTVSSGRRARPSWVLPVGGFALAASVAVAALVLRVAPPVSDPVAVQNLQAAASPSGSVTASAELPVSSRQTPVATGFIRPSQLAASGSGAPAELVIAAPERSTGTVRTVSNSAARNQLSSYMINHARYGGGYGLSGPLSYARVAAHGAEAADAEQR